MFNDNFMEFSSDETDSLTESDLLPDDDDFGVQSFEPVAESYEYDVAVVGGGPAGYSAAIRASQLGARVILFERSLLGGYSLSSECIPSKVYTKAAEALRCVRGAAAYGVKAEGASVNIAGLQAHKDKIVATMAANMARMLRSSRVRAEMGDASLKSAHEIDCWGRSYTASKIIICSGSGTDQIHPCVMTAAQLFELPDVPGRLIILGGGMTGCEIAAAFAAFGSKVMLIEAEKRVLPDMDVQISEAVSKSLTERGVKIYTGIGIKEITERNGCPYVVTDRGGVICDKAVSAIGQRPEIKFLGKLAEQIDMNGGAITVNKHLETSIKGVYAAGDVTGQNTQVHSASRMGIVAAMNAMGKGKAYSASVSPKIVYTTPAAASVGLTEEQAAAKYGVDLVVGNAVFASDTRALIDAEHDGFVKVLAGRRYGEIYGVHIFGARAADLIAEAVALMQTEATIHEAAEEILHPYPTSSAIFAEACADALNRCREIVLR